MMKKIIFVFVIISVFVCYSCSINRNNTSSKLVTHYDSNVDYATPEDYTMETLEKYHKSHYNWFDIAINMSKMLKSNHRSAYEAERFLSLWSMVNPFEKTYCDEGDTIHVVEYTTSEQEFCMYFWVDSYYDKAVTYNTTWHNLYSINPAVNIKELKGNQFNLISNWKVEQLLNEASFANKNFPKLNPLRANHVFRIILSPRARYTIDYFSYPAYPTITRELLNNHEIDYKKHLDLYPTKPYIIYSPDIFLGVAF